MPSTWLSDPTSVTSETSVTGRSDITEPAALPGTAFHGRRSVSGARILGGLLIVAVVIITVAVVVAFAHRRPARLSGAGPTIPSNVNKAVATTTAPIPTTAATSARDVATQFAALLQQNKDARDLVSSATQRVGACLESPLQGIQELGRAIAARNETINRISSLSLVALPGGADMARTLVGALQTSVSADTSFIGWMNDIAVHGCPVATATDASYQAALSASEQATRAKAEFVALWNPVAVQQGLSSLIPADI